MRPKPPPPPTTNVAQFTAPPPPSSKLLDEREIGDDFRRSIDAALKGLEAIYQTSPVAPTDHSTHSVQRNSNEPSLTQTDIQPKLVGAVDDMNEIMLETIESISDSQIGNPVSTTEKIDERKESEDNHPTDHPSSLENEGTVSSQQKMKLSHDNRPKSFNVTEDNLDKNQYNLNKQISFDETNRTQPSSINKTEEKSFASTEESHKTLSEPSLPPVAAPIDINTLIKSPSHNVTYTEIIQSESRDGEQSRRFVTESYDELPTKDDEQTTTLKVITKSEFSTHPALGEKIMEQSIQVITVKVRNETVTTTNNELSSGKQAIDNDSRRS